MKKLLLGSIALLALGAGAYYGTLHLSVSAIRSAVKERDGERLARHVDYPELRKNLKAQIQDGVDSRMADADKNPFAALGAAVAGGFAEQMVDSYITPEGMGSLMGGYADLEAEGKERPAPRGQTEPAREEKPLQHARMHFRGLSEVELITGGPGEEIRFVLTRYGLRWKITNIVLPLDAAGS